jgi:hypothetical protein
MGMLHSLPAYQLITSQHTLHLAMTQLGMAAASTDFSPCWATPPIGSTGSKSRVLVAVLFNKTSLAGGPSLRVHS